MGYPRPTGEAQFKIRSFIGVRNGIPMGRLLCCTISLASSWFLWDVQLIWRAVIGFNWKWRNTSPLHVFSAVSAKETFFWFVNPYLSTQIYCPSRDWNMAAWSLVLRNKTIESIVLFKNSKCLASAFFQNGGKRSDRRCFEGGKTFFSSIVGLAEEKNEHFVPKKSNYVS